MLGESHNIKLCCGMTAHSINGRTRRRRDSLNVYGGFYDYVWFSILKLIYVLCLHTYILHFSR